MNNINLHPISPGSIGQIIVLTGVPTFNALIRRDPQFPEIYEYEMWRQETTDTLSLSRHVTSHPGQLSLAIPSWVGAMKPFYAFVSQSP